jgi:ATP-dependent helicase/nuclease subunit A
MQARDEREFATPVSDIDPRIFGEMVHQLCELRAPEDRWPEIMTQTLAAEDAEVGLTSDLQTRVSKHARRGIKYVEQQAAEAELEQRYDELYVTAELDRGKIVGYIDHLLVTPTTYHIIDYKTGDITEDEVATDAEYYAEQMYAYAVALAQQDADRSVQISLVFTVVDDNWTTELDPSAIDTIQEEIESTIGTQFPSPNSAGNRSNSGE